MRRPRRKGFSEFSLAQALIRLGLERITRWHLEAPERAPGDLLLQHLARLGATFHLTSSEAARTVVADALFAEVTPEHPELRIWKEAALSTDQVTGFADYLIAPNRDYLQTPLLCVVEAKKDDFEAGAAQCLVEMDACVWNNHQAGKDSDIYGIVTTGTVWQFYRYLPGEAAFETLPYAITDLPGLLGALDFVLARCAETAAHLK